MSDEYVYNSDTWVSVSLSLKDIVNITILPIIKTPQKVSVSLSLKDIVNNKNKMIVKTIDVSVSLSLKDIVNAMPQWLWLLP